MNGMWKEWQIWNDTVVFFILSQDKKKVWLDAFRNELSPPRYNQMDGQWVHKKCMKIVNCECVLEKMEWLFEWGDYRNK